MSAPDSVARALPSAADRQATAQRVADLTRQYKRLGAELAAEKDLLLSLWDGEEHLDVAGAAIIYRAEHSRRGSVVERHCIDARELVRVLKAAELYSAPIRTMVETCRGTAPRGKDSVVKPSISVKL